MQTQANSLRWEYNQLSGNLSPSFTYGEEVNYTKHMQ